MTNETRRQRLNELRRLDQALRRLDLRLDPEATARRVAEDYGLTNRLNPRHKWHILRHFDAVIAIH